jgi:uncharacterized protein DUF4339
MSPPPSQTQWYLARDGQQYGPLSDIELAKFVELGHLQPTDLLWREGFPDWRPAMVVFPQRKPPAPRPSPRGPVTVTAPPGAARSGREQRPRRFDMQAQQASADMEDPDYERPRGGALKKVFWAVLILAVLGAGGWFAYENRLKLMSFVESFPSPASGPLAVSDQRSLEVPPLKGFSGTAEDIDATLQETALWRVVKREFPDWYGERLKEAAALAAQNKDDATIGQQMARALVMLRRQQVSNALSASIPRLKTLATTFFENLVELRKVSDEACYEFIAHGEVGPAIFSFLQGSPHTAPLQAQLTAVFEAIADGRKSPRVYPLPRKTDYDTLAGELTKLGWTQDDMALFSDEQALSRARPEKVCQLVHDWFAAQLGLKDPDMQLRLLVDSLKPVVAG